MKAIFLIFSFVICSAAMAQSNEDAIKKTISTFFEGMETNDTSRIRSSLDTTCFLKSIMVNKSGNTILNEEKVEDFFAQVIKFKGVKVKEVLLSYDIKIDVAMALAWTPYKIYFNDKFSHCGVNIFTMIKRGNEWKILGIIDTRRRQGCDELK